MKVINVVLSCYAVQKCCDNCCNALVISFKRVNRLFFGIPCIFVNETVTYYKIYQISGF